MRLGLAWNSLRGMVRDEFSFANIKDMMGASGLPIFELAHLQQRFSGGTSKGQLMDAIDGLVARLEEDEQDRFVRACIFEMLRRKPALGSGLDEVLKRIGWQIEAGEPVPLGLRVDEHATTVALVRDGVAKALQRYRDGDVSGAFTAICGTVDSLTGIIYADRSLGNHFNASYQERVARSFGALEENYRASLLEAGIEAGEVNRIWNNLRGAVNQAAYVLGAFRREFSDAHGERPAPDQFLQIAVDCALFVVRSLEPTAPA